jgi:hypothetical protein
VDNPVVKKTTRRVHFLFAHKARIWENRSWKFCGTSSQRTVSDAEAQEGTGAGAAGGFERSRIDPADSAIKSADPVKATYLLVQKGVEVGRTQHREDRSCRRHFPSSLFVVQWTGRGQPRQRRETRDARWPSSGRAWGGPLSGRHLGCGASGEAFASDFRRRP